MEQQTEVPATAPPTQLKSGLAREIERRTGENAFLCYQCVRCSSGCPVTEFYDYNPNQVMRLVQIGEDGYVEYNPSLDICPIHLD